MLSLEWKVYDMKQTHRKRHQQTLNIDTFLPLTPKSWFVS